ncbi:hypothetical protein EVAR_69131_1 [Eumeta japonica]|uniref:Uncharacterized protein n=1 Tax=Eumeta variegata TaxID=151549 RepID=A0A4C1SLX0_EUMVA|nr:hypothetical protein EVAR_69131_1 [Eumeta japonica]
MVCTSSSTDKKQSQFEETEDAYLYVFAYVLKKFRKAPRRERTVITLRFRSFDNHEDNMREAEKWCTALKAHRANQIMQSNISNYEICHSAQEAAVLKRLLILLNPISGSGRARELFNQHV